MIINRHLYQRLIEWKQKANRHPLILRGARQVGKSFLLNHFGQENFSRVLNLNFEKEASLRQLFASVDHLPSLLGQLELFYETRIRDGECLVFLDEIQNCPAAISKLRYFYEERPNLHVVAAGSLLEFALNEEIISFPVGRVEFLYLFPLVFEEYLEATGQASLLQFLREVTPDQAISPPILQKLREQLRSYWLLGGMPAVVKNYLENQSLQEASTLVEGLLATLEEDFRKYRTRFDPAHLELIFREAFKEVGQRTNFAKLGAPFALKSFQVSKGVQLLEKAFLLRQAQPTHSPSFPLTPKARVHPKIIFLDIGLVQHQNRITEEILKSQNLSVVYRGALAEQFVGQELLALLNTSHRPELFYWTSAKKTSQAEVDFLLPFESHVIPVEVKAGKGSSLASLHQYNAHYQAPLSLRLYDGPLRFETIEVSLPTQKKVRYRLLSVPFFLVRQIPRLVVWCLQRDH